MLYFLKKLENPLAQISRHVTIRTYCILYLSEDLSLPPLPLAQTSSYALVSVRQV